MTSLLNTVFKPLSEIPVLLPLACALNTLAYIFSTDISGWKRWTAVELIRRVIILAFEFAQLTAQFLWEHLPCHVPSRMIQKSKWWSLDEEEESSSTNVPATSIGRVLCQVLELVNDTPVSSEKYEFARALVDKIMWQNMDQGDAVLRQANRMALTVAFSRTLKLLTFALLELQRQQVAKGTSWSWSLIQSIFFRGVFTSSQVFSLENIVSSICSFLFPLVKGGRFSTEFPSAWSTSVRTSSDVALPEKLAQELLWLTEKLQGCSANDEAIREWATESHLATLSLSAQPHVQASLLRISVFLLKDLACEVDTVSRELKMKILLLWLPLFCHAKSGFDCPIFTSSEKSQIVSVLEQNILTLSDLEQETALACWLREYVSSSSEWPNLQSCFERWCFSTR